MNGSYTPRSALFSAAVHFLPFVSPKPLHDLTETEELAAIARSARLAKFMAKEFTQGGWTVAPFPTINDIVDQEAKGSPKPEWIRMPKKGRCPHCGLSRSYMFSLSNPSIDNGHSPPVESVVLRRRGAMRGVRLISYRSLMTYLASMKGRHGATPEPEVEDE